MIPRRGNFQLLVGLLISGIIGLCAGCASMMGYHEKPSISLAGLELSDIGLFEQRYIVKLRIKNPNDIALPIKGMKINLAINGQAFATGLSDENVTIPRFGEGVVNLQTTSNLGGFLKQFKQLTSEAAQSNLSYHIDGFINTDTLLGRFPFDQDGSLDKIFNDSKTGKASKDSTSKNNNKDSKQNSNNANI